jgi:hypothetical protein
MKADLSVPPPVTRTLPSGSVVRLWNERGKLMLPVGFHAGAASLMSSVNAVDPDRPESPLSAAVPALRNLPG